jgi:hypothetical protein
MTTSEALIASEEAKLELQNQYLLDTYINQQTFVFNLIINIE